MVQLLRACRHRRVFLEGAINAGSLAPSAGGLIGFTRLPNPAKTRRREDNRRREKSVREDGKHGSQAAATNVGMIESSARARTTSSHPQRLELKIVTGTTRSVKTLRRRIYAELRLKVGRLSNPADSKTQDSSFSGVKSTCHSASERRHMPQALPDNVHA